MLVGLGGRQVVAGDDCHAVVDFDLDDFIDDGGVRAELLEQMQTSDDIGKHVGEVSETLEALRVLPRGN